MGDTVSTGEADLVGREPDGAAPVGPTWPHPATTITSKRAAWRSEAAHGGSAAGRRNRISGVCHAWIAVAAVRAVRVGRRARRGDGVVFGANRPRHSAPRPPILGRRKPPVRDARQGIFPRIAPSRMPGARFRPALMPACGHTGGHRRVLGECSGRGDRWASMAQTGRPPCGRHDVVVCPLRASVRDEASAAPSTPHADFGKMPRRASPMEPVAALCGWVPRATGA